MRILLDYLPGSEGEAVADILKQRLTNSFAVRTNEDARRFATLDEATRQTISLIYGPQASRVIGYVNPRVTRAYLACRPVDQILGFIRESAADPEDFYHPLASQLTPSRMVAKVPALQNAFAKSFDPDLYDLIATDPAELLRALGAPVRAWNERVSQENAAIESLNQSDVQIYQWVSNRCGPSGVYFRDRTWHESEVAIITTHFNHAGYKSLHSHYAKWRATITHPVICYEAVAEGQEPTIEGSIVVPIGPDNILWLKESLINLAISRLPIHCRYVAWLDHDLIFTNPSWLSDGVEMLQDGYDAVQLFDHVTHLDRDGTYIRTRLGAARHLDSENTSPGGAWIAKRSFYQSVGGLYGRSVTGGGDAVWFSGLTGRRRGFEQNQSDAMLVAVNDYYARFSNAKVGYLPGKVTHLWHGDIENRQYASRDVSMQSLKLDPYVHVEIVTDGLLAWTPEAPEEMRASIRDYFTGRKEDG